MAVGFIGGCPHSGTTLLATMFARHPDCYVPLKEVGIFERRRFGRLQLPLHNLIRLVRRKRHLVEKTPGNINRIKKIRRWVPNARVMLMVRDGRDVAASLFQRWGSEQRGVDLWIGENRHAWQEQGAPDVTIVRYEDLIFQPEQELRRLCDFLGIPFSSVMLDYHNNNKLWGGEKELREAPNESGRNDYLLRNWQVNQRIYDGRGKWKKVFNTVPASLMNGEGAELMHHFGYADPPPVDTASDVCA